MHSIEILMAEHQIILKKLAGLKELLPTLAVPDLHLVSKYMDFIRIYADEYHHAKEEKILFPWMIEQNPAFEFGPIGCMIKEHELGRKLIQNAVCILEKENISGEEIEALKDLLGNFITVLADHIGKEDNVLYQMAEEMDQALKKGDEIMMPGFLRVENELGDKAWQTTGSNNL